MDILNKIFKRKTEPTKTYNYEIIESAWVKHGPIDEIINQLALFEKSHWCWLNENPKIWLIYICALIEKNEISHAVKVLKLYYSYHKTDNLHIHLPVADLAEKLGLTNEKIKKAATVYKALKENQQSNSFSNYLKNKTIAVVGNGGYDLGKGKGKEIDNHDIVIRFNNYPDGYEDDYGTKTDIWVRNGNIMTKDRQNIDNLDYIVWQPNYLRAQISDDHLDILYRDISNNKDKILCISSYYKDDLQKESDILNPTSGCLMLWVLKKHLYTMTSISIYGFSFPYEKTSQSGHYYDKLSNMDIIHNMDYESSFMRNLYYSNGGNNPPYSEEIKLMDINNNL